MKHNMAAPETGNGYTNVFLTIVTVIFAFISRFTLSDIAAGAAIFAGVTTGALNIYKFFKERKTK